MLLRPLAELDHERDRVPRPLNQSRNWCTSRSIKRLRRRGLLHALAQVGLRHRPQVVEVVEEHSAQLRHRGLDVARDRDVDEEQRPVAPRPRPRAATTSSCRMTSARGAGAADHDVGGGQLARAAPRAAAARPPSAAASSLGLFERAAAEDGGPRAAADQRSRGQLAHLARAHQQDVLVLQLAEDLARQLDRHVRDGHRVVADAGLRARPLGRGQRPVAQRVQGAAQRARLLRGVVGLLHLAQDLRLAHHHGLEAGRDAERVPDRLRPRQPVDASPSVAGGAAVEAHEEGLDHLGRIGRRSRAFVRRRARPAVHLDAVAGGEDHRLVEAGLLPHALERFGNPVLRKRQRLPHLEGGRAVADSDHDDHSVTAPAAITFIQTKVKTTAAKPAMPRKAARRPPHPVR